MICAQCRGAAREPVRCFGCESEFCSGDCLDRHIAGVITDWEAAREAEFAREYGAMIENDALGG